MEELLKKIKNPTKEYRAVPFWSWNDKLDPETLKWQIQEMDKAGLGGYFMHARGGLQTEYLSEEWMKCIEACIHEGNRLGMSSWCYDEDGWPSGFAGGAVTALGDLYHVRWLEMEEVRKETLFDSHVLGVYSFDAKNQHCSRTGLPADVDAVPEGQQQFLVRHASNPYYIDILNEKVVKAFLDSTYEEYHARFKEDFGKGMPGFFTDEPQFARGKLPWSYILPERFQEKYGYDVLDVLPALFLNCTGFEKVRYDFWSLVSELFVTSFAKQIFDWCEAHHCQFTGHVMQEDGLHAQMSATAGAMPFYEYMHIPGMDWLRRKIGSPVTPKQVGSVANQLGKKFVLSETFALCGWDVSFEELKWIAEWQYVNGVTMMCQHLEGYTLRGLRKRDYPPSLFFQQSWWEEYRHFNDYFARLSMLLTEGSSATDVLLLHPLKSGWIAYDGTPGKRIEQLDQDFVYATETLSALHVTHHYGDETLLQKYGRVEGNRFILGECSYKAVLLPSMISLDPSTVELLNQFIRCGGKVISLGLFPTFCAGVESTVLEELRGKVQQAGSPEALHALLLELRIPSLRIVNKDGEISSIHYLQRNLGATQVYFMVNLDQHQTFPAEIRMKGCGKVLRYDALKAETEDVYCSFDGEYTRFSTTFLPMQSHIFLMTLPEDTAALPHPGSQIRLNPGKEWSIESSDLNSLTLDYCSYRIDRGEWQGPIHTIQLMDRLLNLKRACDISLRFTFEIDMDINRNREFYLIVETADEFTLCVNGQKVEYRDIGWWKDTSFRKIDIKNHIQTGMNEVLLERKFYQSQKVYDVLFGENVLETEKNKMTYDVELESIYLVGDFGVRSKSGTTYGERKAIFTDGPFVITDMPQKVMHGSLTEQGFYFFAGSIKLSQEIQVKKEAGRRILLDLGHPHAIMSKVFVNGQCAGPILWAPYTVDITDSVTEGENRITVQLFSGNRNLLGPHHNVIGESYAVSPSSFTDKPGWVDSKETTDIWRDRYCFVKFGLAD